MLFYVAHVEYGSLHLFLLAAPEVYRLCLEGWVRLGECFNSTLSFHVETR